MYFIQKDWEIINKELDQCENNDLQRKLRCKKAVLYKYGEGDIWEDAVSYCSAKMGENCQACL